MAKQPIGVVGKDTENAGRRDAFHVPAVYVKALGPFNPGEYAFFTTDDATSIGGDTKIKQGGIVDPFLQKQVKTGQMVWVFVDPGLVDTFYHAFKIAGVRDPDVKPSEKDAALLAKIKELESKVNDLEDASLEGDGCRGCYS